MLTNIGIKIFQKCIEEEAKRKEKGVEKELIRDYEGNPCGIAYFYPFGFKAFKKVKIKVIT